MIGQTISHYKILEKLGEGGMGVLYLAEDLELNRKAVLKFLPPEMINDLDTNLRFKREAQSAGSLSHPNIVTIYDVGAYESKTFIAMEYVEGKNLRESIKSDELTIERISDISVQICEGLNEAHSKGITHRDIKPENILIDEKGKVKIVDFGLAKIKNVSRGITKEGSTVGTIKYMSPEQIRNQTVDHRSDIWSFGVILYEMITGRYPFKGEHDASLFYSIINQTPEPLARYKSDISESFQRIIDKTLDKDPGTRYQHIDELDAIKSVIMNETKSWADGNYERWSDAWLQEKYVFSMYSGPDSYMEILSWDSVAAGIKADFKNYSRPLNVDFTWTDWSIRIFKDCAWVSYIQTSTYQENIEKPYENREIRLLEKKNGLWKIVYSAGANKTYYKDYLDYQSKIENNINEVGYKLLEEKKIEDAIDIFKKNVKLYPKSSNVYDSLGEAYMKNGDKELAIENYKKSLELDPKNENAKEMLNKLAEK